MLFINDIADTFMFTCNTRQLHNIFIHRAHIELFFQTAAAKTYLWSPVGLRITISQKPKAQ